MHDIPDVLPLSKAALFLDFDGTLVRMADRPDEVILEPRIRQAIAALHSSTGGALAIVSGRQLTEIDHFLSPLRLAVSGSHGAERRGANGERDTRSAAAIPDLVNDTLQGHAWTHDLLLERKSGATAIHFRSAPELEAETRALADRLVADHDGLRVIHGHMVAEIAAADRDKGSALRAFMEEAPFMGQTPIAIGDDTTDEDAIRAAQDLGGIGVRIGEAETAARMRFADIDRFHDWLLDGVDWNAFNFKRRRA